MSQRIAVRVKSRILLIDLADIEWVEADGNYVRLHVGESAYLMRGTISSLERHWSSFGFTRIHRSSLVNIGHVRSLEPTESGDYGVQLASGRNVVLSRTFRQRFFELVTLPTGQHAATDNEPWSEIAAAEVASGSIA